MNGTYPVQSLRIAGTEIGRFAVCVEPGAGETAAYAAEELRRYIAEATGETLAATGGDKQIRIFKCGETADGGSLGEDDFEISVEAGNLLLKGGGNRGVLYAVYSFLEETVGCRWYTAEVEQILPAERIDVEEGYRRVERAVFEYRDSFWHNFINEPEFRVKHKTNTDSGKPIPERLGGRVGYNGFVHTLTTSLCAADKYFETHPEYFALREGVRVPKQLCLTNPDVLKIVTEDVLERLAENKQRIISVSQHDNQEFCTCERCRAVDEEEGSHMGSLLRFVNAVADAVAERYPDVMVDTLAYQYTRNIPKHTVPRDNVIIRLCSIECCFRHPLTDEACEENRRFKKDIEDWNTICDNLYIWDYTTDFSHYIAPFPNFEAIAPNVRFFAEHHVKGLFEQGTYNGIGGELGELRGYLLAKLIWNPYMSGEEYRRHLLDFCEGYYGPGGKQIADYIGILQETTREQHVGCFANPAHVLTAYAERLDAINALWDQAEAAARSEAELGRIQKSRMSVMYADLLLRWDERMANGEAEKLAAENKAFYELYVKHNVRLNEWGALKDGPDFTKRLDAWEKVR